MGPLVVPQYALFIHTHYGGTRTLDGECLNRNGPRKREAGKDV
jgi:hypothetical protein